MRNAYIQALTELAGKDANVLAVISDNGAIVYDDYRERYPKQYLNAGIAEANMIAMAAGLAEQGKIPFTYTIGAFLAYRAYEFILNDVCLQQQNVKIIGIGAGFSYSALGPTHHTIFDIPLLRSMPGLTVMSPATPKEVKACVRAAYEIKGPVYIRIGTGREEELYEGECPFMPGRANVLREGDDVTIIGTGSILANTVKAAKLLGEKGVSMRILDMTSLVPFDRDAVICAAKETGHILTIEEHSICGGLGSIVADILAEDRLDVPFDRMGLTGFAKGYGKLDEMRAYNGLGIEDIVRRVEALLK